MRVDAKTPGEFIVIDRATGKNLCHAHQIIEADDAAGYFVERIQVPAGDPQPKVPTRRIKRAILIMRVKRKDDD
jgi:hypothetical protein